MDKKEYKFFVYGLLVPVLITLSIFLTIQFSDILIKYAGITTFYSLLAIFIIFILNEYFRKNAEKRDTQNFLRSLLRASNQIERDLNYYVDNLKINIVPPTAMGEFDSSGLPLEINSLSTRILEEKIIFANSKIETINEWKEGYMDIIIEPDKKERERRAERFSQVWGNTIDLTIKDLRATLGGIKSELGRWINIGF